MEKQDFAGSPLDFDLLSPEALADPWKFVKPIREQAPVFWSSAQNAWLVTRHADVKAGYQDPRLSNARIRFFVDHLTSLVEGGLPMVEMYVPLIVNFKDPPELQRLRTLMFQAFHRKHVEAIRENTRRIVAELLDDAERLGEFDFMNTAVELPIRVLMGVLGVPDEHRADFVGLVTANGESLGSSKPTPTVMLRLEQAMIRAFELFGELIKEREVEPKPDFLSALVQARDQGDRLSHDELLVACFTIMAAGVETTSGALGVFLRTIAGRPDLQRFIREHPEQIRVLNEELNRYPSEVKGMLRVAAADFEWHGSEIKEGDMVYLLNAGANTDPDVFERPYEIDVMRDTSESIGWGTGLHSCIGHLLAKMEIDEFLVACFNRFDVEILQENFVYSEGFALTVYKELKVRVRSRKDHAVAAE